ncbi:unnamed protein product [Bursaphelenchus xylophilus]|uniref:(pine wood nematode) hypothetical protein n=1 Tax=Bursaphelenchus xylophilus TaxID=6326 RepID=A0A7I8WZ66_BURXY|nr:unnamed protein product [Bursaphelenchus xylophilus]CAG9101666.1 unnamed protein product [Bursaphelenchus xylophilus]
MRLSMRQSAHYFPDRLITLNFSISRDFCTPAHPRQTKRMHSTLGLIVCASLAVMVLSQELSEQDSMDKRARSFAFAKRARSFAFAKKFDPYPFGRSFAFAKRSAEEPLLDVDSLEEDPMDKRASERVSPSRKLKERKTVKRIDVPLAVAVELGLHNKKPFTSTWCYVGQKTKIWPAGQICTTLSKYTFDAIDPATLCWPTFGSVGQIQRDFKSI